MNKIKDRSMTMENDKSPQPLDVLMNKLGLTNADLVKASTEQLSFKMVHKGRTGRRITPNVQEKILRALVTLKPDLKVRRRELFQYEAGQDVVGAIKKALALVAEKKILYPRFIDLLADAGINRYAVDVAAHRVIYYAAGGQAHVEQGVMTSQGSPGFYDENALRTAISDTQKDVIDYPTFLKRIYSAGISSYEVNVRNRQIRYKGESQSYKENVPLSRPAPESTIPKSVAAKDEKDIKVAPPKRAVKTLKKGKTWKAVKLHRVKTRRFKRY